MENSVNPKRDKAKILVVDDAPDTLEIIQTLLRFEGYDVLTASTGEEGIKKAKEEKPDVVLLDINLPGIDGNEALKHMRMLNPLQAVIMLTAYATVDNAIEALKEGACDFIKKPFENEHLIHIVNQCFEKYKSQCEKVTLEEEVRRLSITDDLTGLYNHRHFFKTLEAELTRLKRQNSILSLIMIDLDNFKRYNDLNGHLEGDKALKCVGETISHSIRNHVDSGYRYGGDEFAILLIGASCEQALVIAERIRSSIEELEGKGLTVSIGLSEFKEGYEMEEFVKSADDALYAAKHSGGNRIHVNHP